jgi:hypothetical protein
MSSGGGTDEARTANAARNATVPYGRARRWRETRRSLWRLLDPYVAAGAQVAVVGAGNGYDVPLGRLAQRAGRVDLIDIDGAAPAGAVRRLPGHANLRVVVDDVTAGAADAIVRRAVRDGSAARVPNGNPASIAVASASPAEDTTPAGRPDPATDDPGPAVVLPTGPLASGPYDVVIADLFLTQLLYSALRDTGLPRATVSATLRQHGQPLTTAVAARLHASAPDGLVVYVHDLLGWWDGHPQPFTLDALLTAARRDPEAALALAATGNTPYSGDPRVAIDDLGGGIVRTAFWRWPFSPGADYAVCATVARGPGRA